MSAYLDDPQGRIIPLHPFEPTPERARIEQRQTASPSHDLSVPRVIAEIEAILSRTQLLENTIHTEKLRAAELEANARRLQGKLEETQVENLQLREAYRKTVQNYHESYSRFNQLKAAFLSEKSQRERLESQLEEFSQTQSKHRRTEEDLDRLKTEFFQTQRSERNLKLELNTYVDQLKTLSEERRRLEDERKSSQLERDLQKSIADQSREQERILRETLESLRRAQDVALTDNCRLKGQNQALLLKFEEFKKAWSQLKNRESALRGHLEIMQNKETESANSRHQFEHERRLRQDLEDQLSKTKREKDLALKILTEAETKLADTLKELKSMKAKNSPASPEKMIHLEL